MRTQTLGRLYCIESTLSKRASRGRFPYNIEGKYTDFDESVDKAIANFTARYGYRPTTLVASQDDLYHLHVRADVEVYAKNVQPVHFMLYDVVLKRVPKILVVKRTPVL